MPALTWGALSNVPPIALGVAAVMSSIYWIIGRRMKLQSDGADANDAKVEGALAEE